MYLCEVQSVNSDNGTWGTCPGAHHIDKPLFVGAGYVLVHCAYLLIELGQIEPFVTGCVVQFTVIDEIAAFRPSHEDSPVRQADSLVMHAFGMHRPSNLIYQLIRKIVHDTSLLDSFAASYVTETTWQESSY